MKRIWKITAVAVVVAVVVIAAVLVMGQKNDVNWHNGDYVEYTWSSGAVNSTVAEPYAIQTYTVTNVGSNAVTVNFTMTDMSRHFLNSTVFTISPDRPLSAINSWISDGLPSEHGSVYIGKDVVPTTQGDKTADHYQWTFQSANVYSVEVWTWNGIILKKVIYWNDYTHIVTLTNTNVHLPDQ